MRRIQSFTACLVGIVACWPAWANGAKSSHARGRGRPPGRDPRHLGLRGGPEADGNNGGAPRLKLKSIQEMTLIDVDPAPLRGRVIQSATLHLKLAGDEPLRRVTVGGVGAEWFEGTGTGYAPQPGGATLPPSPPPRPALVDPAGGDLCHVILGNGGTTWRMADASPPDADGWQSIAVDPAVVAARVAGLSHGFLVFDDTGSEWTRDGEQFTFRLFPNRFVYSRDQNQASAPYLTVDAGRRTTASRPPRPADMQGRSRPRPARRRGDRLVGHAPRPGPAGTLGFFATLDGRALPRELIPLAGAPAVAGRDAPARPGSRAAVRSRPALGPGRGRGRQRRAGRAARASGSRPDRPSRCRAGPRELPRVACRRRRCRAWARPRSPSSTSWTRSTRSPAR